MRLILPVLLFLFLQSSALRAITNDVTQQVEFLGNPFQYLPPYGRNVWDMRSFNGRLYFGHGNSSNLDPSSNLGPIQVISYSPSNNAFQVEYTVNEQQIDVYRILDGHLVIPGHNPRDGGDLGTYYVLETNGWFRFKNIPQGVHNFDMCDYHGLWFAALGSYGSTILSSPDHGASWTSALATNLAVVGNTGQRIYSFFNLAGSLYSMTLVLLPSFELQPTILVYETNQSVFISDPTTSSALFFTNTSLPFGNDYRVARPTNVGDKLVYILGHVVNDMQWEPWGLYWARTVSTSTLISLPSGAQAWDILQENNRAWVLLSSPGPTNNYWVQVVGTEDFVNWRELLRFQSSTFARSFERLNGDFYFGLGTSTSPISPDTGNVLRVRARYFLPKMSLRISDQGPLVSADSPSEQSLIFERSEDCLTWAPIFTNVTVAGNVSWLDDQIGTNRNWFYRSLLGP